MNIKTKWLLSKRKVYYNILKIFGLCSACFVFEACYGAPKDELPPDYNMNIKGTVKTEDSLKPINNIKVAITNSDSSVNYNTNTNPDGQYAYNTVVSNTELIWTIRASDIDSLLNGSFTDKETTFVISGNEFNNNIANKDLLLKKK